MTDPDVVDIVLKDFLTTPSAHGIANGKMIAAKLRDVLVDRGTVTTRRIVMVFAGMPHIDISFAMEIIRELDTFVADRPITVACTRQGCSYEWSYVADLRHFLFIWVNYHQSEGVCICTACVSTKLLTGVGL